MEGNVTVTPPLTEYRLNNLEQDTEYNITISTVSEAAIGDPSQYVIGQTLRSSKYI